MAADGVDAASAALIAQIMDEDSNQATAATTNKQEEPEVVEILSKAVENSSSQEVSNGERRSNRVRRRPPRFEAGFNRNFHKIGDDDGSSRKTQRSGSQQKKDDHFLQVDCEEEDPDQAPYSVIVHPCARALMELHSHLAETEVIGYLGGSIIEMKAGGVIVHIAEAFPAKCVDEKELGKQGRDAFLEVEMDPESDVEVRTRVSLKGLDIVGWYHSHPFFSCEPSTLDVENQRNYQTLIYKQKPYVAAVVGPYWEENQDFRAELNLFYVRESDGHPVRLKNEITEHRPSGCQGKYYEDDGGCNCYNSTFENEGMALISHYATHPRRVELLAEWKNGVSTLEKLRRSLAAFGCGAKEFSARRDTLKGNDANSTRKEECVEAKCTADEAVLAPMQEDGAHKLRACLNGNAVSATNPAEERDTCVNKQEGAGVDLQPSLTKSLEEVVSNLMKTAESAWRDIPKRKAWPVQRNKKKRKVA